MREHLHHTWPLYVVLVPTLMLGVLALVLTIAAKS